MNAEEILDGKIVREKEPLNLEMPFEKIDGFITPNDLFYVRCHFPVPKIDIQKWRLRIEGAIEKHVDLSLDDLRKMKSRTITTTLECAGNCRNFLEPKVKGVPWGLGAVGNGTWTGVPLSEVLNLAKPKRNTNEVILEGADNGTVAEAKRPDGKINFARSIPLAKALDDVILAYEMNGAELSPDHGFPLRAIVPGWYAVASIKWLQRIIVTDKPFAGFYQTIDYSYWASRDGLNELTPISELQIKAEIARPHPGEIVPANANVRIHGAAWTGDADITKVEVSTDGAKNWTDARLTGERTRNAWQLWEYDWRTTKNPGKQILVARATDSLGRMQPAQRDPNRGTYMINHLLPIEVEVRN
jgi:DMSO/TMAO reductase YedYZ molybdopterin-dependent catalytic subunit